MIQALMLAACGWFLLVPPVIQTGPLDIKNDLLLPYREWEHVRSFDTARDCEADKKEIIRRNLKDMVERSEDNLARNEQERVYMKAMRDQFLAARCIPSDVLFTKNHRPK
jgi:hypothetical protein